MAKKDKKAKKKVDRQSKLKKQKLQLRHFPSAQRFSFFLLSIILVLYSLITAKLFLYPIALAVLIAYLIFPVANWLEKHNLPRIIAILISEIILLLIITGAGLFIYKKVGTFVGDFPEFRAKALSNIDGFESRLGELFGIADLSLAGILRSRVAGLFDAGSNFFKNALTATTGTIFRIGILPVFIFLFLYYRTKFAWFILKLVPDDQRMVAIDTLRGVSKVASRYMGGVFIVVVILAVVNSSAFILIGLKYAMVFGVIAAIWNFIPYFGTIIGFSFPFAFAALTGDSPNMAFKVLVIFLSVQFLENYILTPNIVGNIVKLNPFIIILGLIAGALVWGLPGMFVVIPALAVVRVICEHNRSLQPYVYLLGTTGASKHAITAEKIKRFLHLIRKK